MPVESYFQQFAAWEEGLLAEAEAVAARRVLAYQVETLVSEKQSSKAKPTGRTDMTGENAKSY